MKQVSQVNKRAHDQIQRDQDVRDTSSELLAFKTSRWKFYLNAFRFLRESYMYCFQQPRQRYGRFVLQMSDRSIELSKGVIWSLGCNERSDNLLLKIDLVRDISYIQKASLHVARLLNTGLYHQGYIYVFGGYTVKHLLSSCERYSTYEDRWEFIESLPFPSYNSTSIALQSTQSIYLFGGCERYQRKCSTILRMDLERLTWEVLPVKLPSYWTQPNYFKLDETQVYFVENEQLSVFDPSSNTIHVVRPIGSLSGTYGPSYLFKGVLYKFCHDYQVSTLEVGCIE